MTDALTVLYLALKILLLIQTHPELPQDFKDAASAQATAALVQAHQAQQEALPATIGSASSPVQIPLMPAKQTISVDKVSVTDGVYLLKVSVHDIDGSTIQNAPISMGGMKKIANAGGYFDGTMQQPWYTNFEYAPASKGQQTVTFISGSVKNDYSLTVE